jgi:RHS repeat-associated protein
VRSDGLAYVAWNDWTFGGPSTVSGSQYDPATGSWATPELLADASLQAGGEVVAIDSTQRFVLFGGQGTNGTTEIYARSHPISSGAPAIYTYGFDRLYRLTSVTGLDGNRTYGYDSVGNRASKVAGSTTSYTYDRADRITAAGATSITVDANGNTTARGTDAFTYDQANRLRTATVAGTTETYAYDGDGTRFSRQVGAGTPIRYASDVNGSLPVTIDDGTRKYVYGLGLAYAVSGSTLEVYHADRLGSVRALTNGAGVVTASYRTDEFGVVTATSGASGQPFVFDGEARDATGFTYLRARYYDPVIGRFMSRDALGGAQILPQSLNRYAFAFSNPFRFGDPSGLKSSVLQGPDLGANLLIGGVLLLGGAACVFSGLCEVGLGLAAVGGVAELGTTAVLEIVTPAAEKEAMIVPSLSQGTIEWGLDHIVSSHWWSSGAAGVSKFGENIGLAELKGLIQAAAGPITRVEGTSVIIERNTGMVIGTDISGNATQWLRIVTDQGGNVITAYPIPAP